MRKAETGQTITYKEFSVAAKRDVQSDGRHILDSARRMALNDGIVFGTKMNVGLVRLDDSQITHTGNHYVDKARRTARKGCKTLACAKYEKLSADEKVKHTLYGSALKLMAHVGKRQSIAKIEQHVVATHETKPDVDKLAMLFAK